MVSAVMDTRPHLEIIHKDAWLPLDLQRRIREFNPRSELGKVLQTCLGYLPPELAGDVLERITSCVVMESALSVVIHRRSGILRGGPFVEDWGIVSRHVVTTVGVTGLAAAWANATYDAKYMALGTGAGAEAVGNTTLTEIAANHYTGGVRATCTHVEAAGVVPLVGVHTQTTDVDSVEEHGIFITDVRAAAGLWDRSLTGTHAMAVADTLTGTYTLTLTAGG